MWIPGVISMVTYIILTKKKRSKTARAINRLLKLLLKLRLRSTFLSLTLVADFEQEDRTVPEEAHPDDFARSARTSYITFDPVHLSRANNPDNLYSLINHHRTISDHSYDILTKRGCCLLSRPGQARTGQDRPASSLADLILELVLVLSLSISLCYHLYLRQAISKSEKNLQKTAMARVFATMPTMATMRVACPPRYRLICRSRSSSCFVGS